MVQPEIGQKCDQERFPSGVGGNDSKEKVLCRRNEPDAEVTVSRKKYFSPRNQTPRFRIKTALAILHHPPLSNDVSEVDPLKCKKAAMNRLNAKHTGYREIPSAAAGLRRRVATGLEVCTIIFSAIQSLALSNPIC